MYGVEPEQKAGEPPIFTKVRELATARSEKWCAEGQPRTPEQCYDEILGELSDADYEAFMDAGERSD